MVDEGQEGRLTKTTDYKRFYKKGTATETEGYATAQRRNEVSDHFAGGRQRSGNSDDGCNPGRAISALSA